VGTGGTSTPDIVFVYGTLLPGESRWHHLARFVDDAGRDDAVPGRLFDTGLGFPAAVFDEDAVTSISGRHFVLSAQTLDAALAHLDEVEGAADGGYVRTVVQTRSGASAWSYAYGGGLELRPIESGSWLAHRATPPGDAG
jgi:gamma-glutamylcyclotransferase (GGCT)/AIG2-like uncharacterized protein YtfP